MSSQQDLDQGGTFRQYTRVWLGPSVGWVNYPFQAVLEVKTAGTVGLLRGTNLVKLNVNGNVTLDLPSSLASAATPQALPAQWVISPITIVDKGGFAGGVTYSIVPFGAELISGLASVQLAAPYGTIVLEPLLESGWLESAPMKRIFLTLALLLAPAAASAQCNGVFPNGTICGNITGTPNLPRPVSNSALTGVPGGTSGQTQFNNSGNFGGYTPSGDISVATATGVETIQPGVVTTGKIATNGVSNINLSPGPANSVKGSLNGTTTSDLAVASCSAIYQFTQWLSGTGWQCGINPVLPSRAVAATLNLSAFTAIRTLGYTTPGDGGGADYTNVTTTAFLDSTPTFNLTTAGTGCSTITNTIESFLPASGIGVGTLSLVSVVAGSVSAAGFSTPGGGYKVGDTITTAPGLAGCSVQPVWTVASVTSPTCSFSDTASNHWQENLNGNRINAQACGVKADWNVTNGDAGSTNNTTNLQSAVNFAYAQGLNSASNHNVNNGAIVVLPPRTVMTCAWTLPEGVTIEGAGRYATNLKDCDSEPAGNHFITVGDPVLQLACFGAMLRDLGIEPGAQTNTPSNSAAIIFSNCIQQQTYLERVLIEAGGRSCIYLFDGFGGAEGIGLRDIECGTSGTTNTAMNIAYTGNIIMNHIVIETGANLTANGMTITGGNVDMRDFHTEGYSTGIFMNVPSNSGASSFHHLYGGSHCTNLLTRQNGSTTGVNIIGMSQSNGCTNIVNNAGSTTSGNITGDVNF